MTLTHREMEAIMYLATAMVQADGRATENEAVAETLFLSKYNVTGDDLKKIMVGALAMKSEDAIAIVRNMSKEKKEEVKTLLLLIALSDKEFHANEQKLMAILTVLCDLPR